MELEVFTDLAPVNPFDPAEVDLSVRFQPDGGAAISVPAFAYQDFDPATMAPRGQLRWLVRFVPTAPGSWTAQASLASPELLSSEIEFNVAPSSDAPGFVRVAGNSGQFEFDDGSQFLPIGVNLGWWWETHRPRAGPITSLCRSVMARLPSRFRRSTQIWHCALRPGLTPPSRNRPTPDSAHGAVAQSRSVPWDMVGVPPRARLHHPGGAGGQHDLTCT
jgi:hypothetical protein